MSLITEKEKRDFLANEIDKKILGPGFAQDVYVCSPDGKDEILNDRPQIIYSSGILFPKKNDNEANSGQQSSPQIDEENIFGNPYDAEDDDPDSQDSSELTDDQTGEDAEGEDGGVSAGNNWQSFDDEMSDDKGGFEPNLIGLITCLKNNVTDVEVHISYGRYRLLREDEWVSNVRLKLDERCPLDVLDSTFKYYDKCSLDILNHFGVNTVYDLFYIDRNELTVSPKVKLSYPETLADGRVKQRYVHPSSFPDLPRNKAAHILLNLISGANSKEQLDGISFSDFQKEVTDIENIPAVSDILTKNGWPSFMSHISFDISSNTVKIFGHFNTFENRLAEYFFIYDPVKDYVLDKLLEYRFFKREQAQANYTIQLNGSSKFSYNLGDGAVLFWKSFPSKKKPTKYLRVLLQNCTSKNDLNIGEIPHMFQSIISVHSNGIVSYSEPQESSIDEEFNLNEILYSDEAVFGKGINCAVEWDEEGEIPQYVRTTYSPKVTVRSFSTASDNDTINQACSVHDLSIWGKADDEIIARLRSFADEYSKWAQTQQSQAGITPELKIIIDRQQEFLKRFHDNIDYLEKNARAFSCFRIANTAMYIQMLLGHDPNFKNKSRDLSEYSATDTIFRDCWDYFKDQKCTQTGCDSRYYPFQLAFLVMNVKSVFEPNDPYRMDSVDLIWFPTGGGKTEAYLALTALTIAERRTSGYQDTSGVSVIMRYTLRLLTAQQFERASYLICAMEYLRNMFKKDSTLGYSLGSDRISLGMWIGKAASPNKLDELSVPGKYKDFFRDKTMDKNPFPLVYCPWCGCNLVSEAGQIGYDSRAKNHGDDICLNNNCHFHNGLPIYYIDEQLYSNPPTLLFATVDKFASLVTKEAGKLFGIGSNRRKPDLIIQDELHLISGPLGSLVGLFETFVEELATEKDAAGNIIRKPKIIASTATTRNTPKLISQLYARKVNTFPASGIRYNDNFFSHILPKSRSKRLYMGLSTTGHTAAELEIRAIASELVAKERLITEWMKEKRIPLDYSGIRTGLLNGDTLVEELDLYWTQVLYYINLKSLGRTHSRISQEIRATVENMRRFSYTSPSLNFILSRFFTRNTEFTSRQNSSQIKRLLVKAEEPTTIVDEQPATLSVDSNMDIVQATNMISVGIDIDRWNVMMMVGQPLTTAEYIQASSRAGRHHQGLVINLYNPLRARELSFYENYTSYHQVFYKFVEPLSATTFTETTIEMLGLNLYVGYMVLLKGKLYLKDVTTTEKDEFNRWLESRALAIKAPSNIIGSIMNSVDNLFLSLGKIDTPSHTYSFNDIIKKQDLLPKVNLDHLMRSLRVTEKNIYLNYE